MTKSWNSPHNVIALIVNEKSIKAIGSESGPTACQSQYLLKDIFLIIIIIIIMSFKILILFIFLYTLDKSGLELFGFGFVVFFKK